MDFGHQFRQTVKSSISLQGVGLHTGERATLGIHPAPVGTGLVFRQAGSERAVAEQILVGVETVVGTNHAVTLGNSSWTVQTVEHLLAALAVMGVSDAVLELDGDEVPILDGSAQPFIEAISAAGLTSYTVAIEPVKIRNPIWMMESDKYIIILPANETRISYTIDFNHPLIKTQSLSAQLDANYFREEILAARTFGFIKDVERLQAQGLAMGGSAENAVIFTDDGILNPSLRFADECIRHKVLDLVGDLSLLGRPIHGHIIASKAGHGLDVAMCRKVKAIFANDRFSDRSTGTLPAVQPALAKLSAAK